MTLSIRALRAADAPAVLEVLDETITDNFRLNHFPADEGLAREISESRGYVTGFLEGRARDSYYAVAETEQEYCGLGGLRPCNGRIAACLGERAAGELEIGTMYIRPRYQRQGIAPRILALLLHELARRGLSTFYLDSGYRTSQVYWRALLGAPIFEDPDFFGKDEPYQVWRHSVDELTAKLAAKLA